MGRCFSSYSSLHIGQWLSAEHGETDIMRSLTKTLLDGRLGREGMMTKFIGVKVKIVNS